jgi:hypothetical protein
MSVLNNPEVPEVAPADRAARQIRQQARATFQQLASTFNQTSRQFWSNPQATPAEIAAALGTDAAEVFALHGRLGAMLTAVRPEAIAEGVALVGQFSINADGTVTITTPE